MRLLFLVTATLVLAAAGCTEPAQPPVSSNPTADSADQVYIDVRTLLTTDGVQRGELLADTAYAFDDNARLEFRVVRVKFNKSDGVQDGTMRARRGRYDMRARVLEGYGEVEIVTSDGRKLTSPHLRYDEGRDLVSSDSAFVMVEGNRTQRGIGFETDPQLNRFLCKRACGGSAPIAIPIE